MSLTNYNGIAIQGSNAVNNQIYSNIFQNNIIAVNLTASSTSNIYKNIISSSIGSSVGINLASSGNTIYANTIAENQVGIYMTNSNGNIIYHNNFVNNQIQAKTSTTASNTWDMMVESLPNAFRLKGVENLTEITIALTKAFRILDASPSGPRRACIGIISDVLLQHHAVQIKRWLSDLIPESRSKGFTTLAVMNPQMHPSEEVHAALELFEGEISIHEKEDLQKTVKIGKMYNQRYLLRIAP
jgi:parallel beta-helix repeat protein